MPAPTSYTELQFAEYLHRLLGETVELLGWTVTAGSYQQIINDTLLACDVAAIDQLSGAADMRTLHAVGAWAMWRAVVAGLTSEINYSVDGGKFDREAIWQHAQRALDNARVDALTYTDSAFVVEVLSVLHEYDPYSSVLPAY